jgi:hypothetical protein
MGGAVSGLVGGAMNLAGGLIGGSKAADAAKGQAEALRAAADRASAMAAFTPYGMTTAFGTSNFQDGKGSYTLSPELKAIQDKLFGAAGAYDPTQAGQAVQPIYGGAQSLFNLGQQYLAQSPEQAAQDYMTQQQGLLAGSREQQLAALRSKQLQTGRSGLATGGTATGMAATNPEMAAYYNALAQQDRQLAAGATQAGMERTKFGAGLFGTGGELVGQAAKTTTAGYAPLEAQLNLLGTTEKLGQQPYNMSIDLANQYAQAGARQGQLYLQPQAAAAQAYSQYQGYSPMSAALSGVGSALGGMGGGGASSWFSNLLGSGSTPTSMLSNEVSGLGSSTSNPFSNYNTGLGGWGNYGE